MHAELCDTGDRLVSGVLGQVMNPRSRLLTASRDERLDSGLREIAQGETTMSSMQHTSQSMSNLRSTEEQNKQVLRRFTEEIWNNGKLDQIGEFVAANHMNHPAASAPDLGQGSQALGKLVSLYRTAFPDARLTIEDQIAEGDRVVTRWTATGTHRGELFGMPATGKPVKVTGVFIDRLADGKIAESWGEFDALGMMQQVGAAPAPGQ
jgi:steroid delta-isomerase-like uncharacterized protein